MKEREETWQPWILETLDPSKPGEVDTTLRLESERLWNPPRNGNSSKLLWDATVVGPEGQSWKQNSASPLRSPDGGESSEEEPWWKGKCPLFSPSCPKGEKAGESRGGRLRPDNLESEKGKEQTSSN